MSWYEMGLGTNGKTSSSVRGALTPSAPSTPGWQTVTDEYGTYQISSAPVDAERALRGAAQVASEVETIIRAATTGSDQQRAVGLQRLHEHLSHHDTVRMLRSYSEGAGRIPEDARQQVLRAYERAQLVGRGLPSWASTRNLTWGGVALGVVVLAAITVAVARPRGRP